MEIWIGPSESNIQWANKALAEFGSPTLIVPGKPEEIVQIGVAPNRIDLLVSVGGLDFESAWENRVVSPYGDVEAHWIDLDGLIAIKSQIDHPRHQEDARILKEVRRMQSG